MSIRAVEICRSARVGSSTRKLVLLLLAEHADENGARIFPAVATLAADAELSDRAVQLALKDLVGMGVLVVVRAGGGGRGATTEYRIDLERAKDVRPTEEAASKGEAGSRKGERRSPKGEAGSPEPLVTVIEPDAVVGRASLRDVGRAVLNELGVSHDDPRWAGNYGLVQAWLNAGCDPELDIIPTVRRLMDGRNRKAQGPPGSLSYFTDAITRAFSDRTAPIAIPEPANVQYPARPRGSGNRAGTRDEHNAAVLASVTGRMGNLGGAAGRRQPG